MGLTQVNTDGVKDDAISLAKQAAGIDGKIITYDANGHPVAVGPGTDGQVLTSTGAGSPPAFEDVPAGGATINNATENEIVTVASNTAQLDAEANLTFDGTQLSVTGSATPPVYIGGANPGIKFEDTDASGTPLSYIYASDGQLSLRADDGNETDSSRIDFKVDGTERFRIDKDGYVTKPDTPAFHYYAPSNSSSSSRMTGNNEDIVFANAALNVGSHYNNSNGRFTAPVAGRYLFVFNGLIDNDASGAHRNCALFKNGSWAGVTFCYDYNGGENHYHGMSGSGIISMAANDYVTFRATEGWHCSNETNGGGYLLG